MGIKQLRTGYRPATYSRKSKDGDFIPINQQAEETAKYLASHIWKAGNANEAEEEPRND